MSADTANHTRNIPSLAARRRSLYWRIHFWAALIASPFALSAAATGLVYVLTPQIERAMYARLESVTPAGLAKPLDEAVMAARTEIGPSWKLASVSPALVPEDSTKVVFTPNEQVAGAQEGHQHHDAVKKAPDAKPAFGLPDDAITVYVNPYNGQILGRLESQARFSSWAKKLHSRLLQGDGWRWMIELAASWLIVMLLTGIYLWWPRADQDGLPKRGLKGRAGWRQWHAFIGVALAAISAVILLTGITWSKHAGAQVRALRDLAGQASPQLPTGLKSNAPIDGAEKLSWQAILIAAEKQAPEVALQLTPPRSVDGIWRITASDRGQPTKRVDLALDAYSGKAIYKAGWDQQTAFGKATALGIPFHRGEFGWWNQALLAIFGGGILFSIVSGWVMFFKRSRVGAFGLPKLVPGAWKSAGMPSMAVSIALCILMPLLALSAAFMVAVELTIYIRMKRIV